MNVKLSMLNLSLNRYIKLIHLYQDTGINNHNDIN